jgi:hypothetical protein
MFKSILPIATAAIYFKVSKAYCSPKFGVIPLSLKNKVVVITGCIIFLLLILYNVECRLLPAM